jgi:hypothetical protein
MTGMKVRGRRAKTTKMMDRLVERRPEQARHPTGLVTLIL